MSQIPVYPDELVRLMCEVIAYNGGGMLSKIIGRYNVPAND